MEDLVVIGAGSGGLTAARFAAQLGARVVLVEKHRVGGDCTWTGCVPSKALLKVAKVAHSMLRAEAYGIMGSVPQVDMSAVRDYIDQTISQIYQYETPETLEAEGIRVVMGAAQFLDSHTIGVNGVKIEGKKFIVATGAKPFIPIIPGLSEVSYWTHESVFENERLPRHLIVLGAGPVGVEVGQAYRRLGSAVTLVDERILPGIDWEAAEVLGNVFENEGLQFISGLAKEIRQEGDEYIVMIAPQSSLPDPQIKATRCDGLLVATGRRPNVAGLALEKAGVAYSEMGIEVNDKLQTTSAHIYAAGDCLGGMQLTHFAGWQAFQAARNALLPGSGSGLKLNVPWTVFTDPEIGQAGMTEHEARQTFGTKVRVLKRPLGESDRAVVENDQLGFIKIIYKTGGQLLGATVVSERAGEVINEFGLALEQGLGVRDLASSIHVYPTYGMDLMRMMADTAVDDFLDSFSGKIVRHLTGLKRLP